MVLCTHVHNVGTARRPDVSLNMIYCRGLLRARRSWNFCRQLLSGTVWGRQGLGHNLYVRVAMEVLRSV